MMPNHPSRQQSKLDHADVDFHEAQYQKLRAGLQSAFESSSLPELPSDETPRALNDKGSNEGAESRGYHMNSLSFALPRTLCQQVARSTPTSS
jgi:hypothetical protein